jgi:hypothetical protein
LNMWSTGERWARGKLVVESTVSPHPVPGLVVPFPAAERDSPQGMALWAGRVGKCPT